MPTISTSTKPPACKCPSFFEASIDEGQCGCICRDGNVDCRQRYEGKEGFNISDQRYKHLIRKRGGFNNFFSFIDALSIICVYSHIAHTERIQMDAALTETIRSIKAFKEQKRRGYPDDFDRKHDNLIKRWDDPWVVSRLTVVGETWCISKVLSFYVQKAFYEV